ncbi:MAG: hypothetical protein JZU65_22300 [Chlorobium sp.]|nr:hypothetical protein [Chlorobium sp.]
MAKNNRKLVTDPVTIQKLVDDHNAFISAWNIWEAQQIENFQNHKPFELEFTYPGPVSVYTHRDKPVMFYRNCQTIDYVFSTRGFKIWQNNTVTVAGSYYRSLLHFDQVGKVWQEEVPWRN